MNKENSLLIFALLISLLLQTFSIAALAEEEHEDEDEDEDQVVMQKRSFDPDDPPETTIPIGPYLTFGAQLELEYQLFENLVSEDTDDTDYSVLEPGLTVAFSFDPSPHFQAFLESKIARQISFDTEGSSEDSLSLEIDQIYVMLKDLVDSGLSVQAGRQRFEDEREWLYDVELDAVRMIYEISDLSFEAAVSRLNIVDRDLLNSDEKEKINNYEFYARYEKETEEIETILGAYFLCRDDRTDENNSPVFMGFSGSGDATESIGYWLEAAYVFGEEGGSDISAFGFDVGGMYQFDLPFEPTVTLGYAFGSGDSHPEDGTDSNFRQSGFQSNEGSFNGAADFKYYGEVFDPEISNLSIFTSGFGVNPTEQSSIDIVYHYYLQNKSSEQIRDSQFSLEPDGQSTKLGNEYDLILGFENENKFEAAVKFGLFVPGSAFDSDTENIFTMKIEVQYEF